MGKRFYEKIKIDREWYFVEYSPVTPKSLFAWVTLIVYDQSEKSNEDIADAMEFEAKVWVEKYSIPVFVCAVDNSEANITFEGLHPINNLAGFLDEKSGDVQIHWEVLKNDRIPKLGLDEAFKEKVYQGLPYKTDQDIARLDENRKKSNRRSVIFLVLWLSVIPAAIAVLGWANPIVSTVALLFSLYKAIEKFLIITGKKKTSEKEKKNQKKQQQMEHFYYHCSRNPEGFQRLKQENFDREAREKVQAEVKDLRNNSS